jgi:hypothetical protein
MTSSSGLVGGCEASCCGPEACICSSRRCGFRAAKESYSTHPLRLLRPQLQTSRRLPDLCMHSRRHAPFSTSSQRHGSWVQVL